MAALGFYILLPFLYLLSILPFWLECLVSDFFYFLIYYVIGYRKKVVYENLKNSFPEKSHKELKLIEKKFFHYLCDLCLQIIKMLTISKKKMRERCSFTPNTIALFEKLNQEKRSAVLVTGHLGNWEWACNSFSVLCKQRMYIIYHPLSNKYFDKLMIKMRSRFGNGLYPMQSTVREMVKNRNEVNVTAFASDQTPPPETAYWTTFLNQDTPVFWGTEKIAQKFNYPVVYVTIRLVKRGYYEVDTELVYDDPKSTKEGEITEMHTRRLEEDIKKQPEIWLWSHRRWKYKRK